MIFEPPSVGHSKNCTSIAITIYQRQVDEVDAPGDPGYPSQL